MSSVNPMLFSTQSDQHLFLDTASGIAPKLKVSKPSRHTNSHSHSDNHTQTHPDSPDTHTSRRTINHRSAERRRRQSIKEGMHRLGDVLASAAARCESMQAAHLRGFAGGRRPSKVQMLDAGIEHILVLQQAVVQLAKENEQFRRQSL